MVVLQLISRIQRVISIFFINFFDEIRINNANQVIIGHWNINSLRNKFKMLEEIIRDKFNIFSVSETKLNSSFRVG